MTNINAKHNAPTGRKCNPIRIPRLLLFGMTFPNPIHFFSFLSLSFAGIDALN